MFAWQPRPEPGDYSFGLPRHLAAKTTKELPLIFQWSDERNESFEEANAVSKELVARNVTHGMCLRLTHSTLLLYYVTGLGTVCLKSC